MPALLSSCSPLPCQAPLQCRTEHTLQLPPMWTPKLSGWAFLCADTHCNCYCGRGDASTIIHPTRRDRGWAEPAERHMLGNKCNFQYGHTHAHTHTRPLVSDRLRNETAAESQLSHSALTQLRVYSIMPVLAWTIWQH